MSGYLEGAYARSLQEWGTPLFLPRSEGWLLTRKIPGVDDKDAMGLYPFFCCREWTALSTDLGALEGVTTVTLVTDPFGSCDESMLRRVFPQKCVPFKAHHVIDLSIPFEAATSRHHRRNVRSALKQVQVRVAPDPAALTDVWCRLYASLIDRHDVRGPQRFSSGTFERQLAVPGIHAFLARHGDTVVGITLWYEQGEVAYYHLGAYSPLGYALKASFAIFSAAIEFFRTRVRWAALGAGAGRTAREDGLTRFKQGWATGVRQTYLCGAVLDSARYQSLIHQHPPTDYFPAYRAGEFA